MQKERERKKLSVKYFKKQKSMSFQIKKTHLVYEYRQTLRHSIWNLSILGKMKIGLKVEAYTKNHKLDCFGFLNSNSATVIYNKKYIFGLRPHFWQRAPKTWNFLSTKQWEHLLL